MPTTYTSLLGFALPVTGELSGTWGDTVNDYITKYVDSSVAGTQTISGSQTAVTLTVTNGTALTQVGSGSSGSAQYAVINCTGNPAGLLTITAPASSRQYLIINATSTSQSVKIVGAGPTTGVTLVTGESAIVAWNGSDYVKVASSTADGVTTFSAGTTGFTPSTATSGAVTLAGTLATTNGGTGLTSFTSNGAVYATSTSALTTGTLPTTGGGTGLTSFTSGGAVYATSTSALTTGTLPVGSGGTGATSLTLNNVILGNGTSAVQFVAPGTSGNVLTSNGTTWTSAVLPAGGLTYIYTTTPITLTDKQGALADTSGGAFTITLPATPATGAQVVVADAGASWGTNNLTVARNGSTIGGLAENLVCDITGVSVQLVYDGTTWEVYAQIGGNGGNAATQPGNNNFTGANTFYNSSGQVFGTGTTSQDGIILAGRAGGSSSYRATLTPTTLTGNQSLTLPDATSTLAVLGLAQTFTATQTLTGSSSVLGAVLSDTAEVTTISATAATGTIAYDTTTQSVLFYTSNASANWTVNFRGSSGTSLNTLMSTGQSLTVAFLVTQGSTAYFNSSVQVDATTSGVTTRWQGGTAPAAGNASGVDAYVYTIIKTGSATFSVFASQTRFA